VLSGSKGRYNPDEYRWRQWPMAVRLRVKEVAKEKGFSMGKLQRDADVAYNTVKRMYKNPYHVITTETLGKLAKALGVSLGELIEEVPDTPQETHGMKENI
jgi:DNA-binding Xre family transcriptional regulator